MFKFQWTPEIVGYSLAVVGLLIAFVQGFLIRKVIPKLGENKTIYFGMAFYILGLILFGLSPKGWMMFLFLIPYCLGGIAGPALQGIISKQVPDNEQGELQGALTSLMSLTAIIGPLVMNNLFAYATSKNSLIYLPGASFYLGAVLMIIAVFLTHKTLSHKKN